MRPSETSKDKNYAKTSDQHWNGVLPDSFNVRTAWPQRTSALGTSGTKAHAVRTGHSTARKAPRTDVAKGSVSCGKVREGTQESSSNVTGYGVVSHARDVMNSPLSQLAEHRMLVDSVSFKRGMYS